MIGEIAGTTVGVNPDTALISIGVGTPVFIGVGGLVATVGGSDGAIVGVVVAVGVGLDDGYGVGTPVSTMSFPVVDETGSNDESVAKISSMLLMLNPVGAMLMRSESNHKSSVKKNSRPSTIT